MKISLEIEVVFEVAGEHDVDTVATEIETKVKEIANVSCVNIGIASDCD